MSRYALKLGGYENASVWGYDDQAATYFAQLWRNTSDGLDDPDIWLSGVNPIGSLQRLAELISDRTGASVPEALRAMAAATRPAAAASLLELANLLATPLS